MTSHLEEAAAGEHPPFLTYGFPGTICISVKQEAVHGIPGARLGLVVTLEPIVAETTEASRVLRDRFTVVSAAGSLTAHHEHTVVITRRRPLVLTAA